MHNLKRYTQQVPSRLDDLTKFVLIGREKLVSVKAEIRAIDKLELAGDVREQKKEEATLLAGALLDAEVKIGELTSRIPKAKNQYAIDTAVGSKKENAVVKQLGQKNVERFEQMAKHQDIVEQVKAEAVENDDLPTRTEVLRKIKELQKNERISDEKNVRIDKSNVLEIRKGDFKDVLDDVFDIDAIITDPPYPKEYIQCFSDLSLYASTHVKSGGFVVVYSGQYHLPEVIKRLSEHLTYVWTFCLYHVGKKQLVNGVNIMCGWKPVLIFSNGAKKMRFTAYDVLISEHREKHSHEWQQSESGVSQLIEIFSKPNQLIVDPFAGSGTFGVVAHALGRKFIGAEIL